MIGIRPFLLSDLAGVLELVQATGNFTAGEVSIARELLEISVQAGQRDYFAFVAATDPETENGIRGFLVVGPVPATTGSWHLYWIAVHPAHHGSGIADKLQHFAEDLVRDRGGYWLLAETSSQSGYARARGFYLKHQYRELARIADYYKPADDMILYGKRFGI
jgi:ribosomal protein S18 acetylase RimI-like enzyme